MGKPLMILQRTIICTLIVGYLFGCESTHPAPIEEARVSSGNNRPKNISTRVDEQVSDTSSSSNSGGWIPNPPSDISVNNSQPATMSGQNSTVNNSANYNNGSIAPGSAVPNRNYSDIPKGSFSGDKYIVARGDTLFYVAWITGNDFRELAQKNQIPEPYNLTVGQVLELNANSQQNGINKITDRTNSSNNLGTNDSQTNKNPDKMQTQTTPTVTTGNLPSDKSAETKPDVVSTNMSKINWRWPTTGKVIGTFSAQEGGNKGIDIAGGKGQAVTSAADGRVVYAGNALRGYGNLIIIKHNDDYLSAYAHNDSMLVSEQQDVKAGQKIATMGSSGASSVKLHFEVRYKGKSVNPLQYLPQR